MKDNKIKINIEKNITDGLVYKIKKKLSDVNIKIRTKAGLLYALLMSLNIFDSNNPIEGLIKHVNMSNINKSSANLTLAKLDILINIFGNNEPSFKKKLTNENFPSLTVFEYLIDNLMNNTNEIRKKVRKCIKLFFDLYDIDKFKTFLEKINEKELNELIKDIPKIKNLFTDNTKNDTIIVRKIDINNKKYKIRINTSQKNKKLRFKNNKSFSTKNKPKNQ